MKPDHKIIEYAKKLCVQHKERLTQPRIEVLKIVAASQKPIGAYEVLEKLSSILDSPHPPTVYRAIDFWIQKKIIHRIESLNAYVVCQAEHVHAGSQFMICGDCGAVIESHLCELPRILHDNASRICFSPAHWNIEIHGLCKDCR